MEETFERNSWPPRWRNGVYDFHHYHSTAHEVLGFAAGSGTIIRGEESGHKITVEAGDVAVLPAGTGHCRVAADDSFLLIGAYPPNQRWDICREAPDREAIARMSNLAFPLPTPSRAQTTHSPRQGTAKMQNGSAGRRDRCLDPKEKLNAE
jgi:uncharacterized protein YjlB